ncbi:hypothetical protein [Stenotrophomonas sp. PS02297]|uniref:hypothetical protein n=1 Tax=Stenotrophomonas sp. PS02297 TaxID=2991423 RepID=UPI00249AE64F|nr:hypothetical protein [Stenotrophomonas sp. PS02297]
MRLPVWLSPLIAQIRSNPRLQIGLGLIAAIVLLWVLMLLEDWRQARILILQASAHRLEQTHTLARQKGWGERAIRAAQMADMLKAEIPPAASHGMAQAEFQGWLRQLADTQPAQLRLDVQSPVQLEAPADMVRVTATLSGSMSPSQVIQLISRIEGRQSLTTIPMATLRSDGANRSFSLTIQGFYRLQTKEPQR